jgi:hypothetical protein
MSGADVLVIPRAAVPACRSPSEVHASDLHGAAARRDRAEHNHAMIASVNNLKLTSFSHGAG